MNRDQTVYFTCPHCDERFAQVEELDKDIHTGRPTTAARAASRWSSRR